MRIKVLVLLAVMLSITIGCSPYILQSAPPTGDTSNKMFYALPKGMIRIQTQRQAAGQTGQGSTAGQTGKGSTAEQPGKPPVAEQPGKPSIAATAKQPSVSATAKKPSASATAKQASGSAPAGQAATKGTSTEVKSPDSSIQTGDGQTVLSIESLFMPDPDYYFSLKSRTNVSYDDEVTTTIDTSNNFLKAINISTQSQIGAIMLQVVNIAKEAIEIAALRAKGQYIDIIVDPDDFAEYEKDMEREVEYTEYQKRIEDSGKQIAEYRKELNREEDEGKLAKMEEDIKDVQGSRDSYIKHNDELKKNYPHIKLLPLEEYTKATKYENYNIKFIAIQWEKDKSGKLPLPEGPGASKDEFGGIYYRPLMACKLIFITDSLENGSRYERLFYLPNKSPVIAFDITRPAFTEKVTKLTFTQGVLSEVYFKKPSEAVAALKIPADILKAVSGMPLDLLQFQVNNDKAYNDLLAAQIKQIQQQQQLNQLRNQ